VLDKSIDTSFDAIGALALQMRIHIGLYECYFQAAFEGVFKRKPRSSTDIKYKRIDNNTAIIKRYSSLSINTYKKRIVLQSFQQPCYLHQNSPLLIKKYNSAKFLSN
jgi:hypothetical protein